jgi:hypothetical protein
MTTSAAFPAEHQNPEAHVKTLLCAVAEAGNNFLLLKKMKRPTKGESCGVRDPTILLACWAASRVTTRQALTENLTNTPNLIFLAPRTTGAPDAIAANRNGKQVRAHAHDN